MPAIQDILNAAPTPKSFALGVEDFIPFVPKASGFLPDLSFGKVIAQALPDDATVASFAPPGLPTPQQLFSGSIPTPPSVNQVLKGDFSLPGDLLRGSLKPAKSERKTASPAQSRGIRGSGYRSIS